MPEKITTKIDKLKKLELKNIAEKLNAEKTLNKTEQSRLDELRNYFAKLEGFELEKTRWGFFTKDKDIILSTGAVSRILNYSERNVLRFKEKGCPQEKRGFWNLRIVFKWLRENNQTYMDSGATSLKARIEQEELKIKQAKAGKEEIELKKLKGEVIESDKVLKSWQYIASIIKTRITALSNKTYSKIAYLIGKKNANKVKKILDEEIYNSLLELSEHGKSGIDK